MKDPIERQAAIDACRNSEDYDHTSWEYAYKVSLSMDNEKEKKPEPCDSDEAAKRLNDLIFDINPWEICSQIESDNLIDWCKTIQTEMKMAMVQLPCWMSMSIDGSALIMWLNDWWASSFGEKETPESKAIREVLNKVVEYIEIERK